MKYDAFYELYIKPRSPENWNRKVNEMITFIEEINKKKYEENTNDDN